jgi:uncharacterized membrane protein YfcA
VSALVIAAGAAVVAGAAVQSATGFGFALVAAPLLFGLTEPEHAVGLLIVLGLEVNALTLLGERRRPRPLARDVAGLLVWAVPGALAGVAVLRSLDAIALQLAVTAGVLVSLALRRRAPAAPPDGTRTLAPWARPAAGFSSGALSTATSTSGPPLVVYLLHRGAHPVQVRDTLTTCFVGLGLLGGAALAVTGTREALPDATWLAALVPLAVVGHLAGRPVFARLAHGRYEQALTAVLLVAVTAGLVSALA